MTQLRYVGLDGEMTGSGSREPEVVASKKYQLIQIGLATMEMSERPDLYTLRTFVSDIGYSDWPFGGSYQLEAMEVNKFTPERIRAGPRPGLVDSTACAWLNKRLGLREDGTAKRDLHAVGWNVGAFDMPFVREYLPTLGDRFSYRSVDLNSIVFSKADTVDEYHELKGKAKSGAEVLLRKMGIQPNWHDAGYDAANALMAFKLLREKILPEAFGEHPKEGT